MKSTAIHGVQYRGDLLQNLIAFYHTLEIHIKKPDAVFQFMTTRSVLYVYTTKYIKRAEDEIIHTQ